MLQSTLIKDVCVDCGAETDWDTRWPGPVKCIPCWDRDINKEMTKSQLEYKNRCRDKYLKYQANYRNTKRFLRISKKKELEKEIYI